MQFHPFRYMQWAKRFPAMARFNLTSSGMPQGSLVHCSLDLAQLRLDCGPNPYGDTELRQKLAKVYHVPESHILITFGTSMANFLLASLLLKPQDKVLVEIPTYESLLRIPEYLQTNIQRLPRLFSHRFQLPLDTLPSLCEGVKVAFLTNLHNPSHTLIPESDIQKIAEMNLETLFVFDEVYLDFIPSAGQRIAHLFSSRFFTTGSLTKAYGFGGLRIGWIIGDPEWISQAYQLMDLMEVLVPAPTAHLASLVLDERDFLLQKAKALSEKGWRKTKEVLDATSVSYCAPDGGLSCLVQLPPALKDDVEFTTRLLNEKETLVVPGSFFEAPGFFRLSFGGSSEILNQGLNHLYDALTTWKEL